jgi:hypothetical protein
LDSPGSPANSCGCPASHVTQSRGHIHSAPRNQQQAADARIAWILAELDRLKSDLTASDDQELPDRFT